MQFTIFIVGLALWSGFLVANSDTNNATAIYSNNWYINRRGTTAPPKSCADQRRRMYECLANLQDEMQLNSIDITLKVLSESAVDPFLAQDGLLEKYEGLMEAMNKCRKLDSMFDICAPRVHIPISHRSNESLYIMDKLECMKSTHGHPSLRQIKSIISDNIELSCFQLAAPIENPCVPNDSFQKCMDEELLKSKLLWLVNKDVGSQHFARAYDDARKEKLSRWRCFECVYLTEDRCRPTIMQHDCAIGQAAMRAQAFGSLYRQCMSRKGYENIPAYAPDPKMYLRDAPSGSPDFCGWIIEDLWM